MIDQVARRSVHFGICACVLCAVICLTGCTLDSNRHLIYEVQLSNVTPPQYLADSCVWVPDFEVSPGITGPAAGLGPLLATDTTKALVWKGIHATNGAQNPCGPDAVVVHGTLERWQDKGLETASVVILGPLAMKGRALLVEGSVMQGDRTLSAFVWGAAKDEECESSWFNAEAEVLKACSALTITPQIAKQIVAGSTATTEGSKSWGTE